MAHAEILPGRYPLFVFSHGFSDSAVQGGYLAEHLVAQGWIVAAADHHDPFTRWRIRQGRIRYSNRKGLRDAVQDIANCTPVDRLNYMYRCDEMANALQGLLVTEPFASAIIEDRIAVGGHSFGGFTALGLCGTIPERFDPRIKAVVLLSSNSSGLFYTPEERGAVCMPVMLFIGEHERNNILGTRRVADWAEMIFSDLPQPKYFLEIKGATHASFSTGYELETHPESTHSIFMRHRVISEYVSAFVHKHILESEKAEKRLQTKHPLVTHYVLSPTNS